LYHVLNSENRANVVLDPKSRSDHPHHGLYTVETRGSWLRRRSASTELADANQESRRDGRVERLLTNLVVGWRIARLVALPPRVWQVACDVKELAVRRLDHVREPGGGLST
jgi:hypothetical protein